MKGAFVTGGSGFVGAAVTRRLVAQGARVVALARSQRAAESVSRQGADACRADLLDERAITDWPSQGDGAAKPTT